MKSQSHPFKHLRTILRHRRAVFRHCVLAGIPWQGIKHDLSKFSPSEFIPSARHYDGTRSPRQIAGGLINLLGRFRFLKKTSRLHFIFRLTALNSSLQNTSLPLLFCRSKHRYRCLYRRHQRACSGWLRLSFP